MRGCRVRAAPLILDGLAQDQGVADVDGPHPDDAVVDHQLAGALGEQLTAEGVLPNRSEPTTQRAGEDRRP